MDAIKVSRAAALADVHPATIWRWIQSGRLRSWRLGGSRRVSRQELLGLLQEVGTDPPRGRRAGTDARDARLRAAGLL